MPDDNTTENSQPISKAASKIVASRAAIAADGTVTVQQNEAQLVTVDIADVDLLLGFSDGSYTVIPNGALDAISETDHPVIFRDSRDTLAALFKKVGVSGHAKAGSLRIVTDNVDAARLQEDNRNTPEEQSPEIPAAPAPMVKVSAGIGTGKGPGKGDGDADLADIVTPMKMQQPSVYRVGTKQQLPGESVSPNNFTTALYTSSEYKVTPSGRTDLPLGAFDPTASSSDLAIRASAAKQSTVEQIYGTSGNDTISFNSAFSSGESQWSKTLHLSINGFAAITSITLTFNANAIAAIPGFNIVGLDGITVTRDSTYSNVWHVTPTTGMLSDGANLAVVYDVSASTAAIDFGADITILGQIGVNTYEITNNLDFTWRNAVTESDFDVKSLDGNNMMVLPNAGVGIEVHAGDGNDTVHSGAGPDLIHGGSGDDIVHAGTGNDILDGGSGADQLDGGSGNDTATYANASAGVSVSLTAALPGFSSTGEAAGDQFTSIENLTGSAFDDTLIGDSGVNILNGGDGNDILEGMGGADTLIGGDGANTASYAHAISGVTASLTTPTNNSGDAAGDSYSNIQNLTGSAYGDTLIGDSGQNILNSGSGDDILEGMAGADILLGGSGSNTASYEHAGAGLTASLDNASANTGDAMGDQYTQIQNLTGTAYNDILTGDAEANTLTGGTGDDILEGMADGDSLFGGTGTDTASYAHASTFVNASLTDILPGFVAAGDAADDSYNSIENLTGSNYSDLLIGDTGNNLLSGGSGDDILEGLYGADSLDGGAGSNTASYEHSGAGLTVSLSNTSLNNGDAAGDSYTLIQNLTGSTYADTLVGDNVANVLNGGSGNDILEGMAGADTLNGGIGTDTASYADAAAAVSASLATLTGFTATGDAVGDIFNSIENLAGSGYNDTMIGDSGKNTLSGGGGDDLLEGLGDADTLIGGAGNNTASYEHSAALTASLSDTSINTADAAGDSYLQIQNLTGSDYNDVLIGDTGSNILTGGDGNDTLEGMSNADILVGGLGSDTASYEHAGTYVVASLTSGLLSFSSAGDAAGDTFNSIENLTGSDYADTLIGTTDANTISGGVGDDTLEGLGGNDIFYGGTGSNTVSYEHSADAVTASLATPAGNSGDAAGNSYTDIQNLAGSAYDDTLTGDGNNNTLTGGLGNDTLTGGAGTDMLYGGDGADTLSDDASGAAQLFGEAGNDILTLTGNDATVDVINGGSGTDTLVMDKSGSTLWVFNMGASASQTGGTLNQNWGTTFASFSNIENISVTGSNNLYVYASNGDNVITGGSGAYDYVEYRYATSGVLVNLDTVAHTANVPGTGNVTLNAQSAIGGSGSDTLINIEHINYGSDYNDVIIGNSADNQIGGGRGADYIDGGNGSDTARYDNYASSSVTVSLMDSAINSALGITFTDLAVGDTLVSIENLVGSGYNDYLYGNSGNNSLNGGGGNDILEGMAGADAFVGGGGTDTASYAHAGLASAGTATSALNTGVNVSLTSAYASINSGDANGDTFTNILNLIGSDFNDKLIGTTGDNVIEGGSGNDILEGLYGADKLYGGAGSDTISFEHSTAGVTVDLAGVITQTGDALGDAYSSIENITGSAYGDTLYGDSGDNVIDGGLGSNLLYGGTGNDTADYSTATATLTIDLVNKTVSGAGRSDTLDSIERIVGSNYADTITGSSGDDWIDGGAGADHIAAGLGTDTISYKSAGSAVTVTLNSSSSDGKVLSGFENLVGSDSTNIDYLTGDNANNVIEGGLGNDSINGGLGSDTASYAYAASAVTASLLTNSSSGGEGNDTFVSIENLTGSAYNDTLTGDGNNNIIDGGAGNDLLIGGAGSDQLIGGTGTDTVSYADAASAITVTINGSGTAGDATGDTLYGIENLIGSAHADTITGDSGANIIDGGSGADTIDGAGGVDTITYAASTAAVSVNLGATGTNVTSVAGNDAISNFENIIGSSLADTLIGNGYANIIEGGLGNDALDGGAGTDTVSYENSTAAVIASLATGTASGGEGNDTLANFENLTGSAYDDTLTGNGNVNIIDGGAGNDILIGGAGADQLIGGTGNDTVSYSNAGNAVTASLTSNTGTVGDANNDTFNSIENLTGSAYNDTLYGDTYANILTGGAGNDTLNGYDGNDTLDVTAGRDTAYGGNGDDTFLVNASLSNLPTGINGGSNNSVLNSGGDMVTLSGLTNNATYSLTALANVTSNMEVLNIRGDGVSTNLNMTSLDIRNFVDGGNTSQIWIKADIGDTPIITPADGETIQSVSVLPNTIDYIVYNSSNTQVAQIHWQTG